MKKRNTLSLLLSAVMLMGNLSGTTILANETTIQAQDETEAATLIVNQSAGGQKFTMDSTMSVVTSNGTKYFDGYTALGQAHDFDDLLVGKHSWTAQFDYYWTGPATFNILLSNGDHGITVREYFFERDAVVIPQVVTCYGTTDAEPWFTLDAANHARADWENSRHIITAGYDAENNELFIYVDDSAKETTAAAEGPIATNHPLMLGQDPENTARTNEYLFRSMKLSAGVKTPSEMSAAGAEDTVIWIDADHTELAQTPTPQPVINTEALQLAHDDASKAVKADYASEEDDANWTAFSDALGAAASALQDPQTQEQVDAAATALNQAWLNLRLIPNVEKLGQLSAVEE